MKNKGIITTVFFMIKKCIDIAPILWIVMLAVDAISSILLIYTVKIQQSFFDSISEYIKGNSVKNIIALFICLVLVHLLYEIVKVFGHYLPQVFSSKMEKKLMFDLHEKIDTISPKYFEDSNKLDDINKAKVGAKNAVTFMINFGNIISYYGVYFVGMGLYFYSMNRILALAIVCIFIPAVITQLVRGAVFGKKEDKVAPVRRKMEHYEKCLVQKEYFKETRLLGIFKTIKKNYMDALDSFQKINYKATFFTGVVETSLSLITIVGYVAIIILLLSLTVKNEITVGAFTAIYYSLDELNYKMNNLMHDSVRQISQDYGTINNYIRFVRSHISKKEIYDDSEKSQIELVNVDFSYPNCNNKVLKEINLNIEDKETIAIVGENGSGKTTLVRIIMGLYEPDLGQVLYNGKNIEKYNIKSLNKHSTSIFQNFQKYQMTLQNNVVISDFMLEDKEKISEACNMAGVLLNKSTYYKGLDTMLSKEFGGVDLSGGQWQRIAIARALYKNYNLVVMDEPTSAIDPLEETKLYEMFMDLTKNATSILVTHRIGSAKIADRIVVMKHGEIVEIGTHDELLKLNGEYSRLYYAQEHWYQ